MKNVSDKLQSMMSEHGGETKVSLHIILDGEIGNEKAESLASDLKGRLTDFEFIPAISIVVGTATLKSVNDIAGLSGVRWVDLDSEASVKELTDG